MSKTTKIILTIAAIALFMWYIRKDNKTDKTDNQGNNGGSSSANTRDNGSSDSGRQNTDQPGESPSQPNYNPDESRPETGESGNWHDPRYQGYDPTTRRTYSNGGAPEEVPEDMLDNKSRRFCKFNPIDNY